MSRTRCWWGRPRVVIEEDEKVYAEAAAAPGHANLDIPA